MMNFQETIILEDNSILLRPLTPADEEELAKIAFDYDIWKYNTALVLNGEELKAYITLALDERERRIRYPFTIINKLSGETAGSMSYGNVSVKDKRIEIGWSWLGKKFQGTGMNKRCKFLLMQYAFEHLKFERVEFKTDVLNTAARKALLKIGAIEEGVLRSHTVMQDGRRRDSIYYSVLLNEWESVKKRLFNF
jgi:RimJ/RimL family protein N-acetyltransferase